MEFLCLILKGHFAGKPVTGQQNVGCFLWQAWGTFHPAVQLHVPVTWWQLPPLRHPHLLRQSWPYQPWRHWSSHLVHKTQALNKWKNLLKFLCRTLQTNIKLLEFYRTHYLLMIIYNSCFYHYFVNFQENGDKNGDKTKNTAIHILKLLIPKLLANYLMAHPHYTQFPRNSTHMLKNSSFFFVVL